MVDALFYCKSVCGIIHRDLKPRNILLSWNGDIKLCDFGHSTFLRKLDYKKTLRQSYAKTVNKGSVAYWPVERFLRLYTEDIEDGYDVRVDIWSLGISLAEAVCGELPYKRKATDCIEIQDLIIHFGIKVEKKYHEVLQSKRRIQRTRDRICAKMFRKASDSAQI